MNMNWTAVSAIAAVVATIVNTIIAFSLLISLRALRESQRAKESAIFIWALDRIRDIRPIMSEIREHFNEESWQGANSGEVLKVLEVMQMISFMAEEGIIDRDRIVDMWGKSMTEQWIYLESFIRAFRLRIGERATIGGGAFFARSFEKFTTYARKNMDRRFRVKWPTPAPQTAPPKEH